jgi:hypothetical protein
MQERPILNADPYAKITAVATFILRLVAILVSIILAIATFLGGLAVLTTRVSIDARDSDASTFWQTRFDVGNFGYLPVFHVRYLCWMGEVKAGHFHATNVRSGYAGIYSVKRLEALDHFDAVCKSLEIGGIRADVSNLEVVVAFTVFPHFWESISCANFIPQVISETKIRWQRAGVDKSKCRSLVRQQENAYPTFR